MPTCIALFLAASSLAHTAAEPVELSRKFTMGEKASYKVTNALLVEHRNYMLDTFIPENQGFEYVFGTTVEKIGADGVATMRYARPTMTFIQGESAESDEKRKVEKVNFDLRLDVSSVNDLLNVEDLSEAKKKPAKKPSSGQWLRSMSASAAAQTMVQQFIGQIFQLAQMGGGLQGAMDFAPRLPIRPVVPGDKWKTTVGFSPQKLSGDAKGKQAVQRIDYTMTYKGLGDLNGKQVYLVQADLKLDTNLVDYFKQLDPDVGEVLSKLPIQLDATIMYSLDMGTRATLKGDMSATGKYEVYVTTLDGQAYEEARLTSKTKMVRVAAK
ncbi:MAG: hypothetical protein JST40_04590 [Armatimonadetes bacterium]|nr:hypothetical protein [Armatimonadota bacterium]